jgi:hypothetical protein
VIAIAFCSFRLPLSGDRVAASDRLEDLFAGQQHELHDTRLTADWVPANFLRSHYSGAPRGRDRRSGQRRMHNRDRYRPGTSADSVQTTTSAGDSEREGIAIWCPWPEQIYLAMYVKYIRLLE